MYPLNELYGTDKPPVPTRKIYSRGAISGATLLGGPLAGAYLVAYNFGVFGERGKAQLTWLFSGIAFVLVIAFGALTQTPKSSPPIFMPFLLAALMSLYVRSTQEEDIKRHENNGGETYGIGMVSLVTILGLVATVVLYLILVSVYLAFFHSGKFY